MVRALKKSIHAKFFSMNRLLFHRKTRNSKLITMKFRVFLVFQQPKMVARFYLAYRDR